MRTFFLSCLAIFTVNEVFTKETKDVSVCVYLHKEDNQLNVPLNHFTRRHVYEKEKIRLHVVKEFIPEDDPFKSSKAFLRLLEKCPNAIAVFMSESTASPIVQSICSKLNLPYIQTKWLQHNSYLGSETALNFHPDFDTLAQGLAKVVESLHWNSFVVLYENFDGFMRTQEILKLQKYNKTNRYNIVVQKLNFNEDIRPILKEIKQSGKHRIILDCETNRTMEVLEKAKAVGIMSFIYSYFLTSLDAHTLDLKGLNVNANITTVRIMNPADQELKDIITSWRYNEFFNSDVIDLGPYDIKTETLLIHQSMSLLMEAVNGISQQENFVLKKLSFNGTEKFIYGSQIISYMKTHYMGTIPIENFTFSNLGRRKNFTLYLIEGNEDETLAKWDSVKPETINILRTVEETSKKRQQSLQKGVQKVVSSLAEPYIMLKKDHEKFTGNEKYEGYSLDLMTKIAEKLNFTVEFYIVEDIDSLFEEKGDNWEGIIGEIVTGRAVFAIGEVPVTPVRQQAVDFSMPYLRLGVGILLRKPTTSGNLFAFLEPFSRNVWMYTATLYLIMSVIIYFVARMAPGDWENPHPCNENPDELENVWTIGNCMFLTMGSIMNQGCYILPKGISTRLATSMWWFFALIMTNSYTASLAAFLTSTPPTINHLEDLAKQSRIKYGAIDGGPTKDFFSQSNYSAYRRMYANMMMSEPSVFVATIADGVKRVISTRDGTYAFMVDSATIEYAVQRHCELTTLKESFINVEYAIAMPLDFSFRSDINNVILELQEQGELTKLKNYWWKEYNLEAPCPDEPVDAKLKLEHVGGIFIVLGMGMLLSLLLGILEFFWTVRQESIKKHITYWQAFKLEVMFSLKVWISKKKVKDQKTEETDRQPS